VTDNSPLGPVPGLGYGPPVRAQRILRLGDEGFAPDEAAIAEEVPVAFAYGGRTHAVMMATPAELEDLAVGFTISESIVARASDITSLDIVRHSRGIEVQMTIPAEDAERLAERARALSGRTGCGLCGVEAIDDAVRPVRPVDARLRVDAEALWRAGAALSGHQPLNLETRTVHAAAWATPDGALRIVREDIGRHNALDKVIGALARAGTDASQGFLVVTSRASFELVQKATVAGVPLLAAVSRPTGLAVRLAEAAGLTLVSLLRGRTAQVHAHPERISVPLTQEAR
jgi:formate dehydrogenase accessory protein FdhD